MDDKTLTHDKPRRLFIVHRVKRQDLGDSEGRETRLMMLLIL